MSISHFDSLFNSEIWFQKTVDVAKKTGKTPILVMGFSPDYYAHKLLKRFSERIGIWETIVQERVNA